MAFLIGGRHAVTAIRDQVIQDSAGLRHIDGFRDRERGRVFHHAARVARGELEIVDDRVARILGVQLAVKMAAERLVDAGFAEAAPGKGGRFAMVDHEAHHPRVQGAGTQQENGEAQQHADII